MRKCNRFIALALSASLFFTNMGGVATPIWADEPEPVFYENEADADVWLEDDFDDDMIIVDEDQSYEENAGDEEQQWTDFTDEDEADLAGDPSENADEIPEAFEETEDAAEAEASDDTLTQPDETAAPGTDETMGAEEAISEEAETGEELTDAEAFMEVTYDPNLVGAVTPQSVTNMAKEFAGALEKLSTDKAGLVGAITRFGGLTSAASGAVAILQMCGIIQDPTAKTLSTILSDLATIKGTLRDINDKLDDIIGELDELSAFEKMADRKSDANFASLHWASFRDNQIKPLQNAAEDYKTFVMDGVYKWWGKTSHDGIWICYTEYTGEDDDGNIRTTIEPTYVRIPCSGDDLPSLADNGEVLLPDKCFGIPSEYMLNTSDISWNVDTYADSFKNGMAEVIRSAADGHALRATAGFYQEWDGLDDAAKTERAASYAQEALNTVTYQVACEVMANDRYDWVTTVINAYKDYCDVLLKADSGINALLNIETLTHCFEGEVIDEITGICNSMIAQAGYYGTFAISVAAQDYKHRGMETRQELQELWVSTIGELIERRKGALHGENGTPNFCYFLEKIVGFEQRQVYSTIKVWTEAMEEDKYRYNDSQASGWKVADMDGDDSSMPDDLLGNDNAKIMYKMYLWQKTGNETFAEYLNKNGVGIPAGFDGNLMTSYKGGKDFNLDDGPWMKTIRILGDYIGDGVWKQVSTGLPKKIENKYILYHDGVRYNYIDSSTGATASNQFLCLRAAYLENHGYWSVDEGYVFYQEASVSHSESRRKNGHSSDQDFDYYEYKDTFTFTKKVSMLSLSEVPPEVMPGYGPLTAFNKNYVAKPVFDDPEPEVYSKADWDSFGYDAVETRETDDGSLEAGLNEAVGRAVRKAAKEGISVNLTAAEKADLAARLKNVIFALQEEMKANGALIYRDVFGFGGNDEKKLALAREVLQHYLDEDGNLTVTAENMETFPRYEASAVLHFEMEDGVVKPVINPAIAVEGVLVVWNPELEKFLEYPVSNSTMNSLGLSMNVRLSAVSAGDLDSVEVIRYENQEQGEAAERWTGAVTGSGPDRYISGNVSGGGLFELMINTASGDTGANIADAEIKLTRKLFTYNGRVQKPGVKVFVGGKRLAAGTDYYLTWSDASSKGAGTYTVTITGKGKYKGMATAGYNIKKAKNPLTVTRKKAEKKLSFTKLSREAQTVKSSEMMKVSSAEGAVTYQLVSLVPAKYKSCFSIDKNTGLITVKKGLRKGSYKLKVRIKAAGDANYNGLSKVVVFRAEVK